LRDRSFLELGAGSGLISLFAASRGARVTATDINPVAIDGLRVGRALNGLEIEVIQSDLFDGIPVQTFDVIAVNPPYYRKNPVTDAERAWYCGENGEYFNEFFGGLERYTHSRSDVWMILCDGCDLEMIRGLAARYGWFLRCCLTTRNWVEKNFIFRIERAHPGIL
jgi:release factor glutamine methyltransferase